MKRKREINIMLGAFKSAGLAADGAVEKSNSIRAETSAQREIPRPR